MAYLQSESGAPIAVGKLRGEDYNFEFHGKVKDGKMHFRLVMTEAAAVGAQPAGHECPSGWSTMHSQRVMNALLAGHDRGSGGRCTAGRGCAGGCACPQWTGEQRCRVAHGCACNGQAAALGENWQVYSALPRAHARHLEAWLRVGACHSVCALLSSMEGSCLMLYGK